MSSIKNFRKDCRDNGLVYDLKLKVCRMDKRRAKKSIANNTKKSIANNTNNTKKSIANNTKKSIANNTKVLTYNIFWEAMLNQNKQCTDNVCKYNIANVLLDDEYDLIALQETVNDKVLNIPNMRKIVNKISIDRMQTYYNPSKYKLQYTGMDELESERPITILFLREYKKDNFIMFINLHAGHYYDYDSDIEKFAMFMNDLNAAISRIFKSKKIPMKWFEQSRIIMAGDFNRDLPRRIYLKYNGDVRTLFNNKKKLVTCCGYSKKNERWGRHYDHIIDSFAKPNDIYVPNVDGPASDHAPVAAILMNEE